MRVIFPLLQISAKVVVINVYSYKFHPENIHFSLTAKPAKSRRGGCSTEKKRGMRDATLAFYILWYDALSTATRANRCLMMSGKARALFTEQRYRQEYGHCCHDGKPYDNGEIDFCHNNVDLKFIQRSRIVLSPTSSIETEKRG